MGWVTSAGLGLLATSLVVCSAAGNLLVVAAILRERRLRRQKENLFLVSLAASDLLVGVAVMAFAAVNDLLGHWPFGRLYCRLWVALDIALCTASILNMCAIAFDRYAHISDPMKYQGWVRRSRIGWTVLLLWLLSASIGAVHAALGQDHSLGPRRNASANSSAGPLPLCQLNLRADFAVISSVLSFFLPASVMVFAYWQLYRCARRHVRSIKGQIRAVTESLLAQTKRLSCAVPAAVEEPVSTLASERKARVTLGALMGVFLSCWLPFFVVNIVRALRPDLVSHTLFLAVTWLGYANSSVNPLIYSIFNRDFRMAYGNIVKLFLRKRKLPLSTFSSNCSPFKGGTPGSAKQHWREYHSMTHLGGRGGRTEWSEYGTLVVAEGGPRERLLHPQRSLRPPHLQPPPSPDPHFLLPPKAKRSLSAGILISEPPSSDPPPALL